MKKLIIICFSFFTFHFSFSQSWLWSRNGIGLGYGYSVNSNGKGDCYLSGYYLSLDSIDFSGDILRKSPYNPYGNSMFIVKYDHTGNIKWANHSLNYGNTNDNNGGIVALDNSDNAYVVATFTDTVVVGSDTFIFPKINDVSCYLAKYSSNGNFLWASAPVISLKGYCNIASNYVSTDNNGNAFVTGLFNSDTLHFGSKYVLGDSLLTLSFLAKYDSNGNVLWASAPTGHTNPYNDAGGLCVANDHNGNAYVTGAFTDTIWFSSFEIETIFPQHTGDMFLAKYAPDGTVIWVEQAVLASHYSCAQGVAVKTDQSGNIYVAGDFIDTVTFGSYTLMATNSTNNLYSIFLVKYDSNGNVLWAKQSDDLDNNGWAVEGISIDNYKHIYLSGGGGKGNCKLSFGTDTLTLNDTAKYDAASIVLKFDSNGNMLCGSILQGGAQFGNAIGSDTSGNYVYYASTAGTPIIFGKDTVDPYAYHTDPIFGFNYFPFVARWEACDSNAITASIQNLNSKGQVNLYPNPNNGTFTIALQNVKELAQVEIYNVLGEEIYQANLNNSDTQINLGGQAKGIYFYRVLKESGELVGSGKLIIQK
jgi:hypothetical protein